MKTSIPQLVKLLTALQSVESAIEMDVEVDGNTLTQSSYSNGMVGDYVVVRCRDAGVHAGVLESHHGRECVLTEARRLWKWVPAKGAFLSGVAAYGLQHKESRVGAPVRIHLTENCEIIQCSDEAAKSIRSAPNSHE